MIDNSDSFVQFLVRFLTPIQSRHFIALSPKHYAHGLIKMAISVVETSSHIAHQGIGLLLRNYYLRPEMLLWAGITRAFP